MKIIKIGAIWCSGCLVMKPIWKSIEKENPWLQTQYFDYDDNQEDIKELNIDINRMPTFIFVDKNNVELTRKTGEVSKIELLELIEKYKEL
jgi:thiol-disulfide isomerase/thioredoxin